MTRQQIESIARHYGLVRWVKSGKVEQLRICKGLKNKRSEGLVLAKDMVTGKEHVLWPMVNYECERAKIRRERTTQ